MPVRGIVRQSTAAGIASRTNAPIFVDSDDNIPYVIPAGSGSTVLPFVLGAAGASGARLVGGSGVLVTGSLTIATGLTSVLAFQAHLMTQPTGTGVDSNQILISVITTGSAVVSAFSVSSVTGATVAATGAGATGTFSWFALGA